MSEAIEQICAQCKSKFTTFDPAVKLCMNCYYSDWEFTGSVHGADDSPLYTDEDMGAV